MNTKSLFENLLRLRGIGADDSVIMLKIRTYLSTLGYQCSSDKPLEYFGITLFGKPIEGVAELENKLSEHWIGITVHGNTVEMCYESNYWSFDIYTEHWLNNIREIVEKYELKKDKLL